MGIQIYQGMGSLSTWSNYQRPEIKQVSEEEVRRQEQQQAALQQNTPDYSRVSDFAAQDRRAKAADLENISLTFNKTDSFDYLGSESGLENLDVMKAVSDMRKDEVLQEYQYFVGSSQNFAFQSEYGVVIPGF